MQNLAVNFSEKHQVPNVKLLNTSDLFLKGAELQLAYVGFVDAQYVWKSVIFCLNTKM